MLNEQIGNMYINSNAISIDIDFLIFITSARIP
jgi:hypothetical protein